MPADEPTPAPGFFTRLFLLSWVAYFRTIFDAEFAAGVARLRAGLPALPPSRPDAVPDGEPLNKKQKGQSGRNAQNPQNVHDAQNAQSGHSAQSGRNGQNARHGQSGQNARHGQSGQSVQHAHDAHDAQKAEPAPVVLKEASPEAALQLLALLQREGRLLDFLEEDLASFPDAQIGAAARVVHEGCRKALREHVPLEPIRAEDEGATITLEKGFDVRAIRLSGRVTGEPPFRGKVAHRGWRAREVKLPKTAEGHDATIVAPAEVEL